jgi:hypothetical protein
MFMLGSDFSINTHAHKSKFRMLTEHKLDKIGVRLEHFLENPSDDLHRNRGVIFTHFRKRISKEYKLFT